MDDFSITQYGKPLDKDSYSIDLETKIFHSEESNLTLDFHRLDDWNFKTGNQCIFETGEDCTFETGINCTFKTENNCTFETSSSCTFNTLSNCIFNTSHNCTFNTGSECTFNTGVYCTFKTGAYCTFNTGSECTFLLWEINTCKFLTFDGKSIILDRAGGKRYVLSEDFKKLLKVMNG